MWCLHIPVMDQTPFSGLVLSDLFNTTHIFCHSMYSGIDGQCHFVN